MVSPVYGEPRLDALKQQVKRRDHLPWYLPYTVNRLDALKQQVKPRDHLPWYLPYTVNLDLMLSKHKWSHVTTYHGISRTRWT